MAVKLGKFGAKVAATDSIFKKMDILRDVVRRKYVKCMVELEEFTYKNIGFAFGGVRPEYCPGLLRVDL